MAGEKLFKGGEFLIVDALPEDVFTPEDFNKDPEFAKIAMQDVGETGYTLLVSRSTETEPEYMWVHPDPNLIGIDITLAMKERLGDKYERWHSIQACDHETYGYYLWFDNREKFCANIPLEGTKLNIVSSTYMDEFSKPVVRSV